jgi:puromycin-sensitive aminopeptidase
VARVTERPPYRLPRNVLPQHYSVELRPDFAGARFYGFATIDLSVMETTSEVVLNAAELEIGDVAFTPAGGAGDAIPAAVSYRAGEEQATFAPEALLEPGAWQVFMRFSGKLNDLLRGFYRSKFRTEDGEEAWIAVTQFEATDARRAFPCWDEPDLKATFGISVVADDGLTVLSNAREISSEILVTGQRRTRFADTVKMSTYLVAVVIGPFELTDPREVDGVALRVGSVPGRAPLRALAEEAAAHSLSFLRNYFALPYPGDKLDHVAVPDFASGAMENLGLVTYRENALLIGDDSSQVERQRVVSTIAHETAHMWFGDLVTMRWWEGVWLNEAFATFMELLVTDDFDPRWDVWANFGVARAAALAADSLRSSRAIEYPVGRPEEAEDMFDVITYDKGGSVLRMIERYLGDNTFRQGLNFYLDKHRFANTSTTDLWDALEVASAQPIRAAMGTWVNQPGHPVVSVELCGPRELKFSQHRFLLDGGAPGDQRWVVPVTLRYATAEGGVEREQFLLDGSQATLKLRGTPAWALVNEGAWGVYRTHYVGGLRDALFGALDQLDARERLSLVSDTWAATVAGTVPLESSLQLWSSLRDERDPDVWWAISACLGLVDLVCSPEDTALLEQLTRELAGDLFTGLGWGEALAPQDETPRQARLRARLVTLLGTLGADAHVRQQALERLVDADAGRVALAPDLATAVTQVVAAAGGAQEWDLLYSHYNKATTPQDEIRYLFSLAAFREPALLQRSLDLTFSDEVRSQNAPFLLGDILGRRHGCVLAWEAVEQHWDEILGRWPSNTVHRMLEALPTLAAPGEAMAARANAWLDTHPLAVGELGISQSRERLGINLAFKRRVSAKIGPALRAASAPGAR